MRLGFFLIIILFFSFFCACNRPLSTDDKEVLVSVKERVLKKSEVTNLIPRNASSADSLLLAEAIIKKWVKDVLVYDIALRNLNDEKTEIDKLVDDYRQSLVRYRYQERLIKDKLSANIRESEKQTYYEQNQKKFVLDKNLIKGLFLKIPVDAPGISDVKKWYKQTSEDALEKIEKYSVQNAAIYDYFYDNWVDFNDVMENIPMHIPNTNQFLKKNNQIEVSDSSYWYLLNVKEYLPSDSIAPYDYISPQITEILINQKKVDFLKKFEDDLYNDAIKSGRVKYHTEP